MLLNNKALKYTFFRLPGRKSLTIYQQRKTPKTRKKGVKTRCGGFAARFVRASNPAEIAFDHHPAFFGFRIDEAAENPVTESVIPSFFTIFIPTQIG